MDPLLGAQLGGTIVGSIFGAVGAKKQAQAEQAAANYNALVAQMEGDAEHRRRMRLARRELSAQYTQMAGKSGVLAEEGGWLEQLVNNAAEYEMDALNAAIAGRNTAALERARGRTARMVGSQRAAASLIGGVTKVAGIGLSLGLPGKTRYADITKDSQVSDAMVLRNIGGRGGY